MSRLSTYHFLMTILVLFILTVIVIPQHATSYTGNTISIAPASLNFRGGLLWTGHLNVVGSGDVGACHSSNGVIFYDISDPVNPLPISSVYLYKPGYNTTESSLILRGDRLYVSHGKDWHIVDIADPYYPIVVATQTATGKVRGLAVTGSYLYAGVSFDKLVAYDITLPGFPIPVDSQTVSGGVGYLASDSAFLYCVGIELSMYDIAVPSAPDFVGQTSELESPVGLGVESGYAYVGEAFKDTLRVIDVSDSLGPGLVESIRLIAPAYQVITSGNVGLVKQAGSCYRLRLSNPALPVVDGTIGQCSAGAIVDSLAILCGGRDFRIYNLATPGDPAFIGEYVAPPSQTRVTYASDHVYILASRLSGGTQSIILIVDVFDVSNPRVIGSIDSIVGRYHDILATNNLLFVTAGLLPADTVFVYDVSVPAMPVLISEIETSLHLALLQSQDSLLLASTTSTRTEIWNLADPTDPQPLSTIDIEGGMPTVQGSILFVSRTDQIVSYNIADPTNPVELGTVDSVGTTARMIVVDSLLLHVSDIDDVFFLNVYNVSTPEAPILLGNLTLGETFGDLILVDGIAVLSGGSGVSSIVDLSNPLLPQLTNPFNASAGYLAASGRHIAMSGSGGLVLVELENVPSTILGDVNADFSITSADIIYIVNFVFKSGPDPLPTEANADVNCSGTVTSADVIYLVNFAFKGGPIPDCSP